jgi:hypothetical protein
VSAPHPVRFLAALFIALTFGTYLAWCNWRDARAARKAGEEPEGHA